MRENTLYKLMEQLDKTRLRLFINLVAPDDDLNESYTAFIEELKRLEILIKEIKK